VPVEEDEAPVALRFPENRKKFTALKKFFFQYIFVANTFYALPK
jgi:hypothetical protein